MKSAIQERVDQGKSYDGVTEEEAESGEGKGDGVDGINPLGANLIGEYGTISYDAFVGGATGDDGNTAAATYSFKKEGVSQKLREKVVTFTYDGTKGKWSCDTDVPAELVSGACEVDES
ncbi:pilin [Psychrobacter urativorans]|uniref:pilin n=1 Tax=Psychrobacter urativorans TaxID=45610 RepID=UPI0039B78F5F